MASVVIQLAATEGANGVFFIIDKELERTGWVVGKFVRNGPNLSTKPFFGQKAIFAEMLPNICEIYLVGSVMTFKFEPDRLYCMEEIKILDAVPDDALGITNVFYKAWLATYPNKERGITIEDIEDSYKEDFSTEKIENLKELIRNLPKNKKRLVAKKGELIVGACTVIRNKNNNHLRTLYVLPEFQNRGIGTRLWNKAMEFFDPKKDTIVQVADYTQNAIDFYKRLGFVDTGKRTAQESGSFKSGAVIIDMEMVKKVECGSSDKF